MTSWERVDVVHPFSRHLLRVVCLVDSISQFPWTVCLFLDGTDHQGTRYLFVFFYSRTMLVSYPCRVVRDWDESSLLADNIDTHARTYGGLRWATWPRASPTTRTSSQANTSTTQRSRQSTRTTPNQIPRGKKTSNTATLRQTPSRDPTSKTRRVIPKRQGQHQRQLDTRKEREAHPKTKQKKSHVAWT